MPQRRRILDIHNKDRYISFKDSHALPALIAKNVDTTGNGLIDVWEAAAVTSLTEVFTYGELTEFPELKYFTGLTEIGTDAFSMSNLQTIDLTVLPSSITKISNYAFQNCADLVKVVLPSTITELGSNAFAYSGTTGVDIEINLENITTIGDYGLAVWGNVKNVTTLWSNLKSIGKSAFMNNSYLKTVTVDDTMTVDAGAFASSKALTEVNWNTPTKPLYTTIFRSCEALQKVYFNCTYTSQSVFDGCKALTDVTIGTAVTDLANYFFNGCTSLIEITYEGTKTQWNAITKYANWKSTTMTTVHCTDGDITL